MSDTIVPTITSGVAGPLGILHLPRLWQKSSLHAAGKLHPDYPAAGPGFDQMTLDLLGIERETFLVFIRQRKPTYPELEKWILEVRGGAPESALVRKHNETVLGYQHGAELRGEILDQAGIIDTGAITDAVSLNNLDDWEAFHRSELV